MKFLSYEQSIDPGLRKQIKQSPHQFFDISSDVEIVIKKNSKNTIYLVFDRHNIVNNTIDLKSINAAGTSSASCAGTIGTLSSLASTVLTVGSVGTVGTAA